MDLTGSVEGPKSFETQNLFKRKFYSTEGARILLSYRGPYNPNIGGGMFANCFLDGDLAEAQVRSFDQSHGQINYMTYLASFTPFWLYWIYYAFHTKLFLLPYAACSGGKFYRWKSLWWNTMNSYNTKAELVKSLEDQLAEDEKAKAYTESIRDTVVQARKITLDNLAKVKADKQKTEDILTRVHNMLKKVEASRVQIQVISQINCNNCSQWIEASSKQDNYLSEVFRDYLIPLVISHQPNVINKVRQIVTEYNIKLLNAPDDKDTEVQDGADSQEQDKQTKEVNNWSLYTDGILQMIFYLFGQAQKQYYFMVVFCN